MNLNRCFTAAAVAVLCLFAIPVFGDPQGGGGPIRVASEAGCISPSQRESANANILTYRAQQSSVKQAQGGAQPLLTFFPLAGNLRNDLFIFNYVDQDPSGGFSEWNCSDYTYNGHNGIDVDIRSFAEQIVGVPVFAAQDGVVIDSHDGEDDMNTVWAAQPANYVIIDHGQNRDAWYFHLKKNSVAVTIGQNVSAGEQIGLCASSGVSTGPHLHLELQDNGSVFEPFAGACRSGASGWSIQPPFNADAYLHDFGVTYEDIGTYDSWPAAWPRSGQIALSDTWVRIWWYGTSLPASSTWQVKFVRPNGTIAWTGPTQSFGNPSWRWYNWWWSYNINDMHSIIGTWHVRLLINGTQVIEAPIEVRIQRTADFNRPPAPVDVWFDPSKLMDGEVITCRVDTSLTLDDLDYDVLQYEYVWTANGNEVRRVTSAAHSDTLARDLVHMGDLMRCAVTPNDGTIDGTTRSVSATIGPIPIPALSEFGLILFAAAVVLGGSIVVHRRQCHGGSQSDLRCNE